MIVLHAFYRYMVEILWDVKTLGSHIFETIYLIAVKFTEVMYRVVESLNINFQAILRFYKIFIILVI